MKKTLISLAVAGALAAPVASVNAADFSGFADVVFNGASNNSNSKKLFGANGEGDVTHTAGDVTMRMDVNLALAADGTTSTNSGDLEQALVAYKGISGVTVIGGVFNSPIGQDAEDITDQRFSSHSAVYSVLDNQTALRGNNVAGLAVAGMVGPATVTAAVLNDLGQVAKKNSLALNVNLSPMPGLDLELGYATQDGSAGNVVDINGSYDVMGMATVGLDYLVPENIVDGAYDIWVKAPVGMGVDLGLRYSTVTWASSGAKDSTATSVYASYAVASNLDVAAEYKDMSVGTGNISSVSGMWDGTGAWLNITAKF